MGAICAASAKLQQMTDSAPFERIRMEVNTEMDFPDQWNRFHIPILSDKPQNPIMDAIHTYDRIPRSRHVQKPASNPEVVEVPTILNQESDIPTENDLWTRVQESSVPLVGTSGLHPICTYSQIEIGSIVVMG